MPRQKTLTDHVLAIQAGTCDPETLTPELRAKIRRLGPITMGGEKVADRSSRPLRDSINPVTRRAHVS